MTKRCPQKKRFPTFLAALTALSHMRAKGRTERRAYRCRYCRGWHLTGAPRRLPDGQWPMGLA